MTRDSRPAATSGPIGALRVDQLAGFRIGVTSDRRAADLISALERRGAHVLHAPALRIAPNDHDDILVTETRRVIAARPEVVMVTTGYGMRRWLEVADAAGLGAELTAVLDEAVIMARGPKAVGAVRAAGLDDPRASEHDTTASMVDDLEAAELVGRRVAVQVHGYTDEVQLDRLRRVSSSVLTVTPYRWVPPTSKDRLGRLIEAACNHQLDAVTFTSAPGATATLAAARTLGREAQLVAALREGVLAAAVGPITAGPLRAAGVDPVVPGRHRMGALIRLVCESLGGQRVHKFRSGGTVLEVRGRAVQVDDRQVLLGPGALALFTALAATPSVVPRAELLARLSDTPDDHALEVAISRLRRSLGVPGLITTVVRRGYRLNAVPITD